MELDINKKKTQQMFYVKDVIGKKIINKYWITDRQNISVSKIIKSYN
jgi:hypothetical protein